MPSYQVALLNFEGPLDLLLQLVEGKQLDVTAISLGTVTEQYTTYLTQLETHDPSELNQFVELATRLSYIKSLALLPASRDEGEAEVASLRQELEEYRRYKQAASYLNSLIEAGVRSHTRTPTERALPVELEAGDLSLDQLATAFTDVLRRLPPVAAGMGESITLEEMSARLLGYATARPKPLRPFLEDLADRLELIVAFLALLELTKDAQLTVSQASQFDDMMVSR